MSRHAARPAEGREQVRPQRAGVRPDRLGLAAAAAFCFDPDDPSAALLQSEIDIAGLGPLGLLMVEDVGAARSAA